MKRGIANTYHSVRFRSLLESRWACFFDLLGLSWTYEPFTCSGYIPDFLVGGRLLCEVKPFAQLVYDDSPIVEARDDVMWAAAGTDYRPCMLGVDWSVREQRSLDWHPLPLTWELQVSKGDLFARLGDVIGTKPLRYIGENDFERIWRTAGSRVQWKPKQARVIRRPEGL